MSSFIWKFAKSASLLCLVFVVALSVAACGRKPSQVEDPGAGSHYSYPRAE